MKLNQLSDRPGARKPKARRGRGIGSGLGKTSGRGQKGYKSRSGSTVGSFEGGQTPLHMRLPKRGFSNVRFEKRYAVVNVGRLEEAVAKGKINAQAKITGDLLKQAGVVRRLYDGLRILGKGELKASLKIEAHAASQNAVKAIEAAGGEILFIQKARPQKKPQASSEAAPEAAPESTAEKDGA